MLSIRDKEGLPVIEKITPDNYPELHALNLHVCKSLGVEPKDCYLSNDYDFCPDAMADHQLGALFFNKQLMGTLTPEEQKSPIAHERQHLEQKANYKRTYRNLTSLVTDFFHNFGAMLPSLNPTSWAIVGGILQFTHNMPVYTDGLENLKGVRDRELDSDAASVKATGALNTLTYGKKMIIHHIENTFNEGRVKTYLLEKVHNLKAKTLGTLEKTTSVFGLADLLARHPNPITRGRHIAALEGQKLEDIFPQVQSQGAQPA